MKKNSVYKRISEHNGFSISEMLMAVLILLMVSSVVAAGVPVAGQAYRKVVEASNAEILLSTTRTILREDLGMADCDGIKTDGSEITYRDIRTGIEYVITGTVAPNGEDPGSDSITISYNDGSTYNSAIKTPLVETQRAMKGLQTTYTHAEYSNGIITISGLQVLRADGTSVINNSQPLSIRVLSYSN